MLLRGSCSSSHHGLEQRQQGQKLRHRPFGGGGDKRDADSALCLSAALGLRTPFPSFLTGLRESSFCWQGLLHQKSNPALLRTLKAVCKVQHQRRKDNCGCQPAYCCQCTVVQVVSKGTVSNCLYLTVFNGQSHLQPESILLFD